MKHHKELEIEDRRYHGMMMPKNDRVHSPLHYAKGNVECIDAIKASMSAEAFKGLLKGSIIQYVWRYETKGELEDLNKALWYLNKLIGELHE